MKRLTLTLWLLCSFCFGQQPDVKVRLLTLYHLSQVDIEPQGTVRVSVGGKSISKSGGFSIKRSSGGLEIEELQGAHARLTGNFSLSSGPVPVQHVDGTLEVTAGENFLQLIVVLPLERYVTAALQGETAGAMSPEALKAMAVAIRSYAARFRERHKEDGYDFCDTTHCQFIRLEAQRAISAAAQETGAKCFGTGVFPWLPTTTRTAGD